MASDLILRRAREAFRDDPDDYDVMCDGGCVGRIFLVGAGAPRDAPWFWSITARRKISGPRFGNTASREEAMAAFAAAWRSST